MRTISYFLERIQNVKTECYYVDLDGTLAENYDWKGIEVIGKPIKPMMDRVKRWLENGINIKIFTARANDPRSIPYVKKWLKEQGLPDLEVTNIKGMDMTYIFDDRAIQVEKHKGNLLGDTSNIKLV